MCDDLSWVLDSCVGSARPFRYQHAGVGCLEQCVGELDQRVGDLDQCEAATQRILCCGGI